MTKAFSRTRQESTTKPHYPPIESGTSAPVTKAAVYYPPIESVTSSTVPTAAAAYYLNRKPQTLRVYALTGCPIAPLRFSGRLAWRVSDIRRVMGVDE